MERCYDIFFYDIKTGETLFDYTLEDFIRDNYDETADYDKIYDNVLINVLKDEIPNLSIHNSLISCDVENNILKKDDSLNENNKLSIFSNQFPQNLPNSLHSEECKDNVVNYDKIISKNEKPLHESNEKLSVKDQSVIQNRIYYSYNIFYFKNKYNIINLLPLTNVDIELLKKTFLIKKKDIINPVKIYYRNGNVYKGEINKKYQKNGYGITLYNNGDTFSVLWKKNIAVGYGIYQYFDNTQLIGIWDNDIFHGNNNTIYYYNGDIYQGNIEYNIINGYGIMKYSDGSIYEGYWNNNMHCINGLITYPNGERLQYVDLAEFHAINHPLCRH
jgi:hypothetical protein